MKRLRNLIASVLVVFILLTAVGCGNNSSSFNNNGGSHLGAGSLNEDSNTNTTGENTGVTLSDNLWDFTFQIDGVVYKLPMDIGLFRTILTRQSNLHRILMSQPNSKRMVRKSTSS